MKCLGVLLLAIFGVALSQAARYSRTVSYEGELVAQCTGLTEEKFQRLLDEPSADVWKMDGARLDIRMSEELFERLGWEECNVLHKSVEELVVDFEKKLLNQSQADWFEEYHRYDEIVDWYKTLAENSNSDVIVKFNSSIGKSFEGRDMPAIHISAAATEPVKKIYFQCQIHAREWISGAVCMYVANHLVLGKDERVTKLLKEDSVEFIFVIFANPDGYEYTWTNSRLWRKNRRPGTLCNGVDLNRNYNDHWAEGGSSGNECSETYHGKSAESEPETQNTVNFFRESGNIVGAIDWHSYSQLILRPYGWTTTYCPDEEQLKTLGDTMRENIKDIHGMSYTNQRIVDLYKATGGASDWFYSDDANTKNTYRAAGITIELRDTGRYGFTLPPDQIIPNGEEVVPAVLSFAEELVKNPLAKQTF